MLDLIRKEVEAGRVSEQTHPEFHELSIFKYSDVCSYARSWNEINRQCRGLIINTTTGAIVARSFPKFFNLGEMPESSLENLPNLPFEITEKLDGSMGSIYLRPDGKAAVATPGSMDSPQARKATGMLGKYAIEHFDLVNTTPVCEIIYPENRIVCDYGAREELVLLTIFRKDGTELTSDEVDDLAAKVGMDQPEVYGDTDVTKLVHLENQEGYVVRYANGLRIKIKSPVYVMAHRFLSNINISRVIEAIRDGSLEKVAASCPEVWRSKLDDISAIVKLRADLIKTTAKNFHLDVLRCVHPSATRKDYALWIQANVQKEYQSMVFQLLSNKDITELVWKRTEEELKNDTTRINTTG